MARNLKEGSYNLGVAELNKKGGCMSYFELSGQSLAFTTCHLRPHIGPKNCTKRNNALNNIFGAITLNDPFLDFICQANHTFVFGDMNYRIDNGLITSKPKFESYRQLVCDQAYNESFIELNKDDELAKENQDGNIMINFDNI